MTPTFVVTLALDDESFLWLDALRQAHFPPDRNFLRAHLTIFHKVDPDGAALIERRLAQPSPFEIPLSFTGLRSLGRGVAVEVVAPELLKLRTTLASELAPQLTKQDRQSFHPHVTIQNKVDPAAARELLSQLQATFRPREGRGTAVLIWEYLGGPWRLERRLPLRSPTDESPRR